MHNRALIVSQDKKLTISAGYVIIKDEAQETKVFLDDIDTVVFENEHITVSLATLNAFSERNIDVIICDGKNKPCTFALPIYGTSGTSGRVIAQMEWDKSFLQVVWQQVVKDKIGTQTELLDLYCGGSSCNPDVEAGDAGNAEGIFADYYFHKLFGKWFKRHRQDNLNIALNYGYAVLLSKMCTIVYSHGYITQLGVHHIGSTNKFNLAYDILEPFRPLVDRVVCLRGDIPLDSNYKKALISVLNATVCYNGKECKAYYAMELYFLDVIKSISCKEVKIGGLSLFGGKSSSCDV